MTNERRKILEMVAKGMISIDEGDELIIALQGAASGSATVAGGEDTISASKIKTPRYLRLQVHASRDSKGNTDKDQQVNIRIPIQFLKAGVKLAAFLPKGARDKFSSVLQSKGIDADINNLKPQQMDELLSHLSDFNLEVNADNETVRISCE